MTLPNFLVIGAGRAGTTSLYHHLRQHPAVFMSPVKETNFFAYRALRARGQPIEEGEEASFPVRTLEAYTALFEKVSGEAAVGEASPRYMADAGAAAEIVEMLPDVRLVSVLRNPIERAHSSYLFHRRDGREQRSFECAIREEREETAPPGLRFGQRHYVALGLYDRLLAPYFERFSPDRIGVFLYDDLASDPDGFLRGVYGFLGVDPAFESAVDIHYNESGVARSAWARAAFRKRPWALRAKQALPARLRHGMDRWIETLRAPRLEAPPLSEEARQTLAAVYAEDVARLERRIGRDLSSWRAGAR